MVVPGKIRSKSFILDSNSQISQRDLTDREEALKAKKEDLRHEIEEKMKGIPEEDMKSIKSNVSKRLEVLKSQRRNSAIEEKQVLLDANVDYLDQHDESRVTTDFQEYDDRSNVLGLPDNF